MHGGVISMQHWGCELRSCAGSGGAKPGWKMSKHLIRIIIPKRFFFFRIVDNDLQRCSDPAQRALDSVISKSCSNSIKSEKNYALPKVTCSKGFILSSRIFSTSLAKTASAGAVESIQLALMEITTPPLSLQNRWQFRPTIRAWSG